MKTWILSSFFVSWSLVSLQCEKFIEAYVPEIFLELETELEPDNLCFQSGLCTATAVEAALANKRACKVCQHFAQDALTFLEKNKTREEIIIALHLACSHLQDLSKQVCYFFGFLYSHESFFLSSSHFMRFRIGNL